MWFLLADMIHMSCGRHVTVAEKKKGGEGHKFKKGGGLNLKKGGHKFKKGGA